MSNNKITSIEALETIRNQVDRHKKSFRLHAMLCGGTACRASDSSRVLQTLIRELAEKNLKHQVEVIETGCNGFCAMGPVMTVLPDNIFYQQLTVEDIPELVDSHFKKGKPVERLMYSDPVTGEVKAHLLEIPFFSHQQWQVLKNKGLINPESIDEYIWQGGYRAVARLLTDMTPDEIITEVKEANIRGRGGAGFPTGLKWEFCARATGDIKYVLCNADEGDPGAFMDRSVMEADPHSILEGMIAAARAIGSPQGYIYCRAEYPLAIRRLEIAIEQATEYGLLGRDIFGLGFDFNVEIYQGAGAFVCGEETALMTSIEGKRGTPRPRPPFPAISGLWKKPTILNNVETYANIPQIILEGGETYAETGTQSSKGTKIFALTGKVNNIGLVEVPMGTSIGKIIFDIGGGVPDGKKFKAAQLGGPSGGCIPAEHLNTPTDYEEIAKVGAIMGSGGMIVMDEDTCMVDMARFFMDFCQDESCGKCTPCRVGTKRMLEILQAICRGEGKPGDIELLEDLAYSIKDTALCGLGQTAPNPVLSTIRYFREEYEEHIYDKHCRAAVCSELFKSPCQHSCPVGMEIPAYIALIGAGRIDDAYKVMKRTNPFPAVCGRVCGHPCQSRCRRGQLDDPLAIKFLKRFVTDNAKKPVVEIIPVTRKEKIAVIGAGPSGLTAALELKKRGYAVTVFEKLPSAGGMLRWGIPAYRLPRDILDGEIQDILDTGVELNSNTTVGKDIMLDTILSDFAHVYVAVGAQSSMNLGIEGEDATGCIGAVEFLRKYNLSEHVTVGRRVAVIGGGNSAIDAARTALRLGAGEVTIYYRRERKDMPAQEDEIVAAEEEGITIEYLVAPLKIKSVGGKVAALKLSRMQLGLFDRSGRKRPEAIEGAEFEVELDNVIAAIGQQGQLEFLPESSGVKIERSRIAVDHKLCTDHPRIWAGGDVVTGPAMIIDAIKAGQDVAVAIDETIRKSNREKPWKAPKPEVIEIPYEVEEDAVVRPQAPMPMLDPKIRRTDFSEVELGYARQVAIAEASRCIRCDGSKQDN
jgi:NADH-quinone oxidoreductase subunit F